MRRYPRGNASRWWHVFVFTLLVGFAELAVSGEEIISLISYTNVWRYNEDAKQPPATWQQPAFNDSGWSLGEGAFGRPANENLGGVAPLRTILSFYAPTGSQSVMTYYFRTEFTFPYTLDSRVLLTASNLIDDGAVFFINGNEIARIGMPTGAVTYVTLANRTREVSTGPESFAIPLSAIVQGVNTFAVELHQNVTNSTDAVFGMSLTARMLDPVVIVREPEDVTIEEGRTLTLSVDVTGSDPGYQWYRDNLRLANYTSRELVWPNVTANNAGNYYCVVSNALNVVTSRFAIVTVEQDVTPPRLILAEEYLSPTISLILTFDDRLLRPPAENAHSPLNPANYVVREFGTTNVLPITNIVAFLELVRFAVPGGFKRGSLYTVTVTNLADVRSNVMTEASFAYVGFYAHSNLAALHSTWAWDESGSDLGTGWRQRLYDDRHWARGAGVFAFEFDNVNFCDGAKNTVLSLGPTTYYFRYPFFVPRTSGKAVFSVKESIDDGAVFYLNGQELRRINMPVGPVTAGTRALVAREAVCTSVPAITATNLVEGTNVFAVEVHQATADFDVVFGMQIDAAIQLPYPLPVPLNIARMPSGELEVSWAGREGLLQSAPSPAGPWLPLTTNSPAVLSPTLGASFFRLDPFVP